MTATAEIEATERPILFKGEMVRAILDDRKTQTRRIIKPQPTRFNGRSGGEWIGWPISDDGELLQSPFGGPGDRLWVRETWCNGNGLKLKLPYDSITATGPSAPSVIYAADNTYQLPSGTKWRPSIFMPRWASRLSVEVKGVRVERLQEISEDDAKAEGVDASKTVEMKDGSPCYTLPYQLLWNKINGCDAWDVNPWVWVVEFKRI